MIRSDSSHPEPSIPPEFVALNRAAFSQLYDQYAPALLGVITAIVGDETEAARLLEVTFTEIRSQFGQSKPPGQPLFVWLLSMARRTASEASKSPKPKQPDPAALGLTDPEKKVRAPGAHPTNELLAAVLFQNCTPEEAASLVGLPVETARQHLRLAMRQWRTSGTV